jgi:hypothetical protein
MAQDFPDYNKIDLQRIYNKIGSAGLLDRNANVSNLTSTDSSVDPDTNEGRIFLIISNALWLLKQSSKDKNERVIAPATEAVLNRIAQQIAGVYDTILASEEDYQVVFDTVVKPEIDKALSNCQEIQSSIEDARAEIAKTVEDQSSSLSTTATTESIASAIKSIFDDYNTGSANTIAAFSRELSSVAESFVSAKTSGIGGLDYIVSTLEGAKTGLSIVLSSPLYNIDKSSPSSGQRPMAIPGTTFISTKDQAILNQFKQSGRDQTILLSLGPLINSLSFAFQDLEEATRLFDSGPIFTRLTDLGVFSADLAAPFKDGLGEEYIARHARKTGRRRTEEKDGDYYKCANCGKKMSFVCSTCSILGALKKLAAGILAGLLSRFSWIRKIAWGAIKFVFRQTLRLIKWVAVATWRLTTFVAKLIYRLGKWLTNKYASRLVLYVSAAISKYSNAIRGAFASWRASMRVACSKYSNAIRGAFASWRASIRAAWQATKSRTIGQIIPRISRFRTAHPRIVGFFTRMRQVGTRFKGFSIESLGKIRIWFKGKLPASRGFAKLTGKVSLKTLGVFASGAFMAFDYFTASKATMAEQLGIKEEEITDAQFTLFRSLSALTGSADESDFMRAISTMFNWLGLSPVIIAITGGPGGVLVPIIGLLGFIVGYIGPVRTYQFIQKAGEVLKTAWASAVFLFNSVLELITSIAKISAGFLGGVLARLLAKLKLTEIERWFKRSLKSTNRLFDIAERVAEYDSLLENVFASIQDFNTLYMDVIRLSAPGISRHSNIAGEFVRRLSKQVAGIAKAFIDRLVDSHKKLETEFNAAQQFAYQSYSWQGGHGKNTFGEVFNAGLMPNTGQVSQIATNQFGYESWNSALFGIAKDGDDADQKNASRQMIGKIELARDSFNKMMTSISKTVNELTHPKKETTDPREVSVLLPIDLTDQEEEAAYAAKQFASQI